MSKFTHLVDEINAALEVYLAGRTGQQYNRTAYILCDDGAELASKLFLTIAVPGWSDTKANGHFKKFKEFTGEVRSAFHTQRPGDHPGVCALLNRIEDRRERRNKFFHSTDLLDLNFHARDCVDAFCDLLDYGKLLFPAEWQAAVSGAGNMETCEAIIRLDRKAYGDPSVGPKVNDILAKWPRNGPAPTSRGCEVAHYAEDMHLRLAIRNGGNALRDKLMALL